MFYEAELRLLRQTFLKCRVQTGIVELSRPLAEYSSTDIFPFLTEQLDLSLPLSAYLPPPRSEVVYRLQDPFGCCYLFFLLPELPDQALMTIGPYLSEAVSSQQLMELAEANRVDLTRLAEMRRCYDSLPILPDSSHLFLLLESFCERIWGNHQLTIEELNKQHSHPVLPAKISADGNRAESWSIQALEQRYQYENQLMDAVAMGQIHKATQLFASISPAFLEQRTADALRNTKNYCIIMNTLSRKAAERGGVHPMYLDRTSSAYAVQIEQTTTVDALIALMAEMFQGYCRLVRDFTTRGYSPLVQKTIIYIDANLAENLALNVLAEKFSISASYLSTLFRKETGLTLTDYVNRKRIQHAEYLLSTTRLQVQTIAQHCGIMDVQYFSKVFKRLTGSTPKEYRNNQKT